MTPSTISDTIRVAKKSSQARSAVLHEDTQDPATFSPAITTKQLRSARKKHASDEHHAIQSTTIEDHNEADVSRRLRSSLNKPAATEDIAAPSAAIDEFNGDNVSHQLRSAQKKPNRSLTLEEENQNSGQAFQLPPSVGGPPGRKPGPDGRSQSPWKEHASKYPHIVRVGKRCLVELHCAVCGVNGSYLSKCHFKGIVGVKMHLGASHGQLGLSDSDIVAHHKKRDISEREALALARGLPGAVVVDLIHLPGVASTAPSEYPQDASDFDKNSKQQPPNRAMAMDMGEQPTISRSQLAQFPTIFQRSDGVYVELKCGLCGSNAATRNRQPFRGIYSFNQHLLKTHRKEWLRHWHLEAKRHKEEQINLTEVVVLKLCTARELPSDDIANIKKSERGTFRGMY